MDGVWGKVVKTASHLVRNSFETGMGMGTHTVLCSV